MYIMARGSFVHVHVPHLFVQSFAYAMYFYGDVPMVARPSLLLLVAYRASIAYLPGEVIACCSYSVRDIMSPHTRLGPKLFSVPQCCLC